VGTNIQVNSCSQQWKFSNRNGSDGITTTGSTQHSIYNRSWCIEDMSIKGIREAVGTNIQVNSSSKQRQLSHCDGSYGIATDTCNRISDDTGCIEDMSIECIWEAVGTNIQVNSSSKQRQFSHCNISD